MTFTARTLLWQRRILSAAVVLSALVFWRAAFSVFTMPKATVILLATGALLGVSAVRVARTRRVVLPASPLLWPLAAFATALVVATIVSHNPLVSIAGRGGRMTGLAMYGVYIIVFLACVRLYRDHSPAHLAKAFLLVAAPISGYGFLQLAGADPYGWSFDEYGPPVFGTLGNPNFFSAWVGMVAVLGLWGALTRTLTPVWRVFAGLVGLACATAAALSYSLQGPAAFTAGAGLFLAVAVATVPSPLRRHRWTVLAAAGVAGTGLLAAISAGVGPLAQLRDMALGSYRSRSELWASALAMFGDRPLLGQGLDMFAERYWIFRSPEVAAARGLFRDVDTPHSVPLDMLSGGGLVLGLAYLAVLVAVGWALARGLRTLQGEQRLLLGAFGGVWAAYQVQSLVSINVPVIALVGWVAGGVVMALGGGVVLRERALSGTPALSAAPSARPGSKKKKRQKRTEPVERLVPLSAPVTAGIAALAVMGLVLALVPLVADVNAGTGRTLAGRAGESGRGALESYTRAVRLAPWDSRYPARLARELNRYGDIGEAFAMFDIAWRRAPGRLFRSTVPAQTALRRDGVDARIWYDRALEADGWLTPSVLRDAGRERLAEGDAEGAVDVFRRAVAAHPDRYAFWVDLGDALAAAGQAGEARVAYQRALQLNPNAREATEGLQRLG